MQPANGCDLMASVFDDISDRPYISLQRDVPLIVDFEEDEPCDSHLNDYQQTQHDWNVNGSATFGVSSKPLLREMKKHKPLGGKMLQITKTGKGYDTKYTVVDMSVGDDGDDWEEGE